MESVSCPVIIGARLLPAVKVGAAIVSVDPTGRSGPDGKPEWRWFVDAPAPYNLEATGADLRGYGDAAAMLESLLGFLAACGESLNWRQRYGNGSGGDNAELFPPAVAQWCADMSDELSLAAFELEQWREANRD